MNELLYDSVIALVLVALEMIYFKVAAHFAIIDKPNQRSSHAIPTIRGGGIVFVFALLVWFITHDFEYPALIIGALMIAVVSFLDDIGEQSARIRLVIQLVGLMFIGWQAGFTDQPVWISFIVIVVGVGTLNAFNFMDGINGITGVYSLVNLVTFYYINRSIVAFTENDLIITMITGVVVFLFFNFRKRARCFAGDVGSVTIAFVQLFLLLKLVHATNNYGWILLFLVYGVDTVITIVYRLTRKENIFQAHRQHLFQYFSNELGVPHLWVALLYGTLQAAANVLLLLFLFKMSLWLVIAFGMGSGLVYIGVREYVLKRIGVKGLIF